LNTDTIGSIRVAIPPSDELLQILTFLDRETAKIDELVAEQRRLMELLKEKRQAVISHAVTKGLNPNAPMKSSGVEWLGDIPAHWLVRKLSRLVSTRKGIAFKAEHFTENGAFVVKASDIKNLTIRQPETFLPDYFLELYPQAILKTGEIILSTVGSAPEVRNSAVGQLGLVPNELSGSLLNQNTVVFVPSDDALTSVFLFFALQTVVYRDHLDLHAHGTANQASLNISAMLDFAVPLPSRFEQESIVTFLRIEIAKIDTLTAEAQRAIDLLQERRTALISAAVTGQIDVRSKIATDLQAL
jgi:type I restriction enzyme, S subunit